MRALAAILILSACSRLHAQPSGLKTFKNILDCAFTIGSVKCLNALSVWRAKRAINQPNLKSNITHDLEQFPWMNYRNNTEEELYSELCDGTEQLLQRRSMTLSVIPGYRLELLSKGNGMLNVDVYKKNDADTGRSSMKKAKKTLYKILPLLVLPGLIMSAILPFILPALKLMVVGAGMLNNMALTGAVFTLLRNNAFNDRYEHKVIYANEGYKNEKQAHTHFDHHEDDGHSFQHVHDYQLAESNPSGVDIPEIETIDELPLNSDWIKQYYGRGQSIQKKGHEINRGDGLKD